GLLLIMVAAGAIAQPGSVFGRFYTSPLLLEFALGMLIGLAHPRLRSPAATIVVAAMVVATLVIVFVPIDRENGLLRLAVIGLPSAVLVTGALLLEARGLRLDDASALVKAGSASYAVYLSHPFALGAVE